MKYRLSEKEKLLSLGTYPETSLQQARQKRDEAKKLLAAGQDPSLERQREKQQSITDAELTFEKVATDWLQIKARTLAPNTLRKMEGALKGNIFNRVGKHSIKDLRYKDIQACLFIMQARGALRIMHETRRMIKSIFDFAVNDGLIDLNPITQKDDRLHEHMAQNMPHLQNMADAGKLLRNLTEYGGNFEVQACVYLTLHIAQRPSELRMARWDEFDFDNALWTLPLERSKTRKHMTKAHVVPLSKQVMQRLNELKQYTGHSEFLFLSTRTYKPLSEATIRQALRTTFTDYHIVPHGCRHFFSTQANESGLFRKEAIDAFLQHKDSNEISATYNKALYAKEREEIAQWWSDQLDMAQAGAKVLPFKQA
ncbi:tyrosine-type recombinase/integrase [Methylophilus sp. Leaf408]|uniref:tyrosine-type recombinase/integrase n=1 Tax=Methylophilus sp. Leaf408 TaxID=2876561 RepID=UPI001E53E339|nr:tyrosine-type recombinase/integrase [Methylophilus sp. Leaf408]